MCYAFVHSCSQSASPQFLLVTWSAKRVALVTHTIGCRKIHGIQWYMLGRFLHICSCSEVNSGGGKGWKVWRVSICIWMADRRADSKEGLKEPSISINFRDIVSKSERKAALHAVAVPKRNDLCFTFEFEIRVSTNCLCKLNLVRLCIWLSSAPRVPVCSVSHELTAKFTADSEESA